MGSCCSGPPSTGSKHARTQSQIERERQKLEKQKSKKVNEGLKQYKRAASAWKKLLLLGAGSSGKSTLFRQLKCIHGSGLDRRDKEESARYTRYNLVQGILKLLGVCARMENEYRSLKIDVDGKKNVKIREYVSLILEYGGEEFDRVDRFNWISMKELGLAILNIWQLPQIQRVYSMRFGRFALVENLNHFFEKSDEIFSQSYVPTHEDVLLTRTRTAGIINRKYELQDNYFEIVDVGGQRNERKKWIHQFSKVTAVIFVAALNHYNCVLFEDERRNAMHESLDLFSGICNNKHFRRTEIILFLNKEDLMKKLLRQEKSLAVCFTQENGWEGEQWVSNFGGPSEAENGANEYFVPPHLRDHYQLLGDDRNEVSEFSENRDAPISHPGTGLAGIEESPPMDGNLGMATDIENETDLDNESSLLVAHENKRLPSVDEYPNAAETHSGAKAALMGKVGIESVSSAPVHNDNHSPPATPIINATATPIERTSVINAGGPRQSHSNNLGANLPEALHDRVHTATEDVLRRNHRLSAKPGLGRVSQMTNLSGMSRIAEMNVPELNGEMTVEELDEWFIYCHRLAISFIKRQYFLQNEHVDKRIFYHVTTATNKANVEAVFWDVQDIVIRSNLINGGFVM